MIQTKVIKSSVPDLFEEEMNEFMRDNDVRFTQTHYSEELYVAVLFFVERVTKTLNKNTGKVTQTEAGDRMLVP